MSTTPAGNEPYGERFAAAWEQLQRYLGDLDALELAKLAKLDLPGTLEVLKEQPALGHSGALNDAANKSPEELAAAILAQRLAALTQGDAQDRKAFGAQFLEAWRQFGGSVSLFRYATIQELKAADKDAAIAILKRCFGRSSALTKLLESGSPEVVAERLMVHCRVNQALFIAAVL